MKRRGKRRIGTGKERKEEERKGRERKEEDRKRKGE
jgi:hypothetical protein